MKSNVKSIRSFIGSKHYAESRRFYQELGFIEHRVSDKMCYFKITEDIGFYLQDYYVRSWANNSMLFLEVDDVDFWYEKVKFLKLDKTYRYVRLHAIKEEDWGREFFLHDPSGVLWHIGEFKR